MRDAPLSFPQHLECFTLCPHFGKQVAFYFVINLMLEITILFPSLK